MAVLGEFDDQKQGIVNAAGDLTVSFTCPLNQKWVVSQVTLEMLTAPAGATAVLKKGSALVAPAFSARKSALGGEPPVPIRGGETISIVWDNCTPGDIGKIYMLYNVSTY